MSFAEGWLAGLGFAMQIYFDFSGYSDIAIGLGLLFGIVIPDNFDAPYSRHLRHRFLAALAHDAVAHAARLSLHLARRQPPRPVAPDRGAARHHAARRAVARRRLDLRHLGRPAWLALAANHLWRRAGAAMPVPLGWLVTFLFVVAAFVVFRAEISRPRATCSAPWPASMGFPGGCSSPSRAGVRRCSARSSTRP